MADSKVPGSKRCLALVAVLLILAVGGGIGLFLVLRGRGGDGDAEANGEAAATAAGASDADDALDGEKDATGGLPEFEGGDKPETKASGVMRGANKALAKEEIVRENRFYGMGYSPYGLGDNRLCPPFDDVGKQCLLSDQVLADVRLISTVTNRIKLYSLLCEVAVDAILSYCSAEGIEVMLGIWVSESKDQNEAELKRLERVLKKHGDSGVITDVMVGNEPLFVVGVSVENLVAEMKTVRSMLKKAGSNAKIGTAEIYNVWKGLQLEDIDGDKYSVDKNLDMKAVVAESDWIGLNTHAYYGGVSGSSSNGGKYVFNEFKDIEGTFDKPVYITETGYPTKGAVRKTKFGTAKPSVRELELFATQVEVESRKNSMPVYFFEPFDGDWKRRWLPFSEADYSFGLFTCDRELKDLKLPPVGAL